ncbi:MULTISPECIES: hypothetical protein [Pseudanabaena]|uniref:Type II secretion system protein GspC N-terminal domain-containing protein n=2 Tax=Pseudanabaena TaxID=1152 RepID=L8N3B3_9CYAN|nr:MULTISPECIES: hypothetical protein [Pseudanabaena]ELS33584.1 hypothetical protein Pse7429DRAFT_1275 [Pseudanabaena biceps PCC 7429]MDG3494232.1 hypothetical protein [Pseudanabaena catenata USMAC16]
MMQNTDNKNQFYVTQDVDAYTDNVDNLMDDLFGEVESTLHVDYAKQRSLKQKSSPTRSSKTHTNSAPYSSARSSSSDIVAIAKMDSSEREISTSKDTVSITKLNVADISLPPISKQDVLWIQPYIMRNPEPSSNLPPIAPPPETPKSNLLDRLLLVFACSSALLAAVMWTINHGIWLGRQSVIVPQVANSKENADNKNFGEEIKRMLAEVTDKNRAIASPNNALGSNLPLMTAPLISTMPLPVGANNPFANGMQQPMYVPVYQPPTVNGGNNLPSPLALPPATAGNTIDVTNGSPNARTSPTQVSSNAVASAPTPSYTLIGVLDLGDRSTAMFDMNGSVQSIGLGKAISNTGWYVSRVSQQEITIKRGKESKTIFVGQKF